MLQHHGTGLADPGEIALEAPDMSIAVPLAAAPLRRLVRRMLRQFAYVLMPKLLSGLGSAGISMVLMRYLEPAPFGAVTLCLSAILLADGILGSAFDLTAVRLASECQRTAPEQALQIQRSCLRLKMVALAVGALAAGVSHAWILRTFFKDQASWSLLVCTGLAAVAVLLLRSAQLQYQLSEQFHRYGLLDLVSNGLKCAGIAALIAMHHVSVTGVLAVFVFAPGVVLVAWGCTHGRTLLVGEATRAQLLKSARTASWFLLTLGVGALVSRLDLWMVARYVPQAGVGLYSAAQLLALVLPMLGTYLSVILSPRVMPLANSGRLLRATCVLQGGLIAAALMAYAFALLFLPHLHSIFPQRFAQALPLFAVLLPGALAGVISFPLTLTTLMFLQPRFLVALDVFTVPVIVSAYIVVIPRFGLIGAAWVTSATSVSRALVAQVAALYLVRKAHHRQRVNAGPLQFSTSGVSDR